METLPLSEVGARLSEIAGEVVRTHQRANITHDGRSYVVLISAQDLESLEATLELLSDPESMARVAQADAHLSAGHQTRQTEIAAFDHRRGRLSGPKKAPTVGITVDTVVSWQ